MHREKDSNIVAFIHNVNERPILWNRSNPEFNDWTKKMATWGLIATKCGFSDANAALKKFNTIKNARRNLKRNQSNGAACSSRKYLYEDELLFLDGFDERMENNTLIIKSDNDSNIECDSNNDDLFDYKLEQELVKGMKELDEPQTSAHISQPSRKRRCLEDLSDTQEHLNKFLSAIDSFGSNGNEQKNEDSEGKLFGLIVGQRLDRLTPRKRAQAQMGKIPVQRHLGEKYTHSTRNNHISKSEIKSRSKLCSN
ncbi:hypothetical protein M3Y97_00710700 [Aphelenchoides bicaudatus]|nr:hypothetical protein M3Y97_00710700 [Aphelenchoides bicaudatus]